MDKPTFSNLLEVEVLVEKFLNKTLPISEWTHVAHLTSGLYLVSLYGPAEAMTALRKHIFEYNESVGTINSDLSGYHETITQFWVWLLAAYLDNYREQGLSFLDTCNALLKSRFAAKDVFFKFIAAN